MLGLCAALLVSGGGAPDVVRPELASPSVADTGRSDAAPLLMQRVTRRLVGANPTLSPERAQRIASAVLRSSEKYGLDPQLVTDVLLTESTARPWARSSKGAVGLMQVMPHMFGSLEIAGNPATIESNIEVGCWILGDNIRRLGEDDGILAYFWGTDIRGASYLQRVREARVTFRPSPES